MDDWVKNFDLQDNKDGRLGTRSFSETETSKAQVPEIKPNACMEHTATMGQKLLRTIKHRKLCNTQSEQKGIGENSGVSLLQESVESGGHKKLVWNMMKSGYALVDFNTLPEYLKDNEYILKYYRADWPIKQTLWSIFRIHNETLNIWTHLIGFLFFLGLTVYTSYKLPKVKELPISFRNLLSISDIINFTKVHFKFSFPYISNFHIPQILLKCLFMGSLSNTPNEQCILKPTPRWPIYVFLGGAMLCLLTSSTCHLLSCHSCRLSTLLWRLDYAGITTMIAASYFPPVYYTFLCKPFWRYFYLIAVSIIGMVTVSVSLIPAFQERSFRKIRALLFFGMGIFGVIPGAHKLVTFWNDPMCLDTLAQELTMGCYYILGTVFYAARIPERWKPGLFDIAGHSHQIFHVLVIAGAYTHYKSGLIYLAWRDSNGCES